MTIPKKKKQVKLFNGEPVINVKEGRDGIFRFACGSCGKFSLSTISAVRQFMRGNKYKFYVTQQTNFESITGEGA